MSLVTPPAHRDRSATRRRTGPSSRSRLWSSIDTMSRSPSGVQPSPDGWAVTSHTVRTEPAASTVSTRCP